MDGIQNSFIFLSFFLFLPSFFLSFLSFFLLTFLCPIKEVILFGTFPGPQVLEDLRSEGIRMGVHTSPLWVRGCGGQCLVWGWGGGFRRGASLMVQDSEKTMWGVSGRKRRIETKFPFFSYEAVSLSEKFFFAFLKAFWFCLFFNLCSKSNFF